MQLLAILTHLLHTEYNKTICAKVNPSARFTAYLYYWDVLKNYFYPLLYKVVNNREKLGFTQVMSFNILCMIDAYAECHYLATRWNYFAALLYLQLMMILGLDTLLAPLQDLLIFCCLTWYLTWLSTQIYS